MKENMKENNFDDAIREAVHKPHFEINIHDKVMDDIEKYETTRLKRLYVVEIFISSFLIALSIGAMFIINWYFEVYGKVFDVFPLGTNFYKLITFGLFFIILTALAGITLRLVHLIRTDRRSTS
ncbi:MAG: hypothetical protein GY754_03620 [bacterium]|nr:hypothetical protein [bacterium]